MGTIRLTTGRECDANRSIVGIDDEGNVYDGYDGTVDVDGDPVDGDGAWSNEDKRALADLMIARWQAFRAKAE